MIALAKLYLGDCLDRMKEIPAGSVDMVLCDLPYGTTQNRWDAIIPFAPLWAEYERVCRGAVVLFAAQPFTSALVMSNPRKFRYEWIWEKEPSGHLNAKRQPMRAHESILVFGGSAYYPQGLRPHARRRGQAEQSRSGNYGESAGSYDQSWTGYPTSIQFFAKGKGQVHPTQKPVALLEYLIRTYTNEGEAVLDNTMGSGSTGVACINTGRKFIGIERDPAYFELAKSRISENKSGSETSTKPGRKWLQAKPQPDTDLDNKEESGSPSRARTCDNSINSRVP